jgi:diguanylate cyclase (GGDEF)-like protein
MTERPRGAQLVMLEVCAPVADANRMRTVRPAYFGVLAKVLAATCLLLVALGGIAWAVIATTRGTTGQGDAIADVFAERATTDRALLLTSENSSLVAERLGASDRVQIAKLDGELVATDAQLATAIAPALGGADVVTSAEAGSVRRIRAAYLEYLRVRERVLHQVGSSESPSLAALDRQLDRGVNPLLSELTAYANAHFREGREALATLRRDGQGRNELLALLLGFALVSLIATVWVARGIVVRLREYAEFSAHVAEGDLGARLDSRRRDELGTLAASLNTMVEQLTDSASERGESVAEEAAYRTSQEAFSELLQVTESEREAHAMLKRHIERGVAGSEVVVLNRNNSRDRLEATTELREDSPLLKPLQGAEPRSCLAVRLTRPFESGGETPALLECELCGITATPSTCVPLLVSGEVIGSVLVDHEGPLCGSDERRVHDSVAQAAPVLANLRNLALAEARALTDALTGLPNRRAIQDTLKRMLAQSARTVSPLAAVLIDLDHFKQINDTCGHEDGDSVLAAVGDVLASQLRTSDFAGRNGGEEFVVLLPDTGTEGALELAEKLRAAIAAIKLPRVERLITASFGVAIHPDAAGDAETLLRLADRALYAAKNAGRNRVELAGSEQPAPLGAH